uniref:Uncharacterized protein n=1 Tax=uncultured bacterium contig00062 TaxID=1181545 RepID=A0A806KKC6_9BACT|nr:hypothetical protein [uncultured bacterium contig00062]
MEFFSKNPIEYENPTIMHLVDYNTFFEQYRKKCGRPETKWEDLNVSFKAKSQLVETAVGFNFFSYIIDLKQWSATDNERIKFRDSKETEKDILPYLQLGENDFDPIEVYAYYIGLAINNMHQGTIYTKYLLSYPVMYEKTQGTSYGRALEKAF